MIPWITAIFISFGYAIYNMPRRYGSRGLGLPLGLITGGVLAIVAGGLIGSLGDKGEGPIKTYPTPTPIVRMLSKYDTCADSTIDITYMSGRGVYPI